MSRIVIGVDAGGTSCVAARAENGAVSNVVTRGAANVSTAGAQAAATVILDAIDAALDGAQPAALYVGAAGAADAERARALSAFLERRFVGVPLRVGDDALIALRATIPQGPGAVLIAGTGSIAYAVSADASYRSGGLGHLLGDEGSAYALGLAAIRWIARALDGRAPVDRFTDTVGSAFGTPSLTALKAAFASGGPGVDRMASVAPVVLDLAGTGDRVAVKLIQSHAMELGELLKSAVRKAGLLDRSPAVALAGGLLRDNSLLTYLLETRITGDIPGAEIVRATDEPYLGAVRLAHAMLHE